LKNPRAVIPPERDKSSNDPARAGEEKSQSLCAAQIPRKALNNLRKCAFLTDFFYHHRIKTGQIILNNHFNSGIIHK
jgi:hypothetical protein